MRIFLGGRYDNFLRNLFPVFSKALMEIPPQFVDSDEQKIRNMLLEILNRLPNTDSLKKYVLDLGKLVMHILTHDNSDNAIICLKIIFDVHKNFATVLEGQVGSQFVFLFFAIRFPFFFLRVTYSVSLLFSLGPRLYQLLHQPL